MKLEDLIALLIKFRDSGATTVDILSRANHCNITGVLIESDLSSITIIGD